VSEQFYLMTHNSNPSDENQVFPFTVSRALLVKQYDSGRKIRSPPKRRASSASHARPKAVQSLMGKFRSVAGPSDEVNTERAHSAAQPVAQPSQPQQATQPPTRSQSVVRMSAPAPAPAISAPVDVRKPATQPGQSVAARGPPAAGPSASQPQPQPQTYVPQPQPQSYVPQAPSQAHMPPGLPQQPQMAPWQGAPAGAWPGYGSGYGGVPTAPVRAFVRACVARHQCSDHGSAASDAADAV
jgi:hypothetical protein